jgi:hypothetical protein
MDEGHRLIEMDVGHRLSAGSFGLRRSLGQVLRRILWAVDILRACPQLTESPKESVTCGDPAGEIYGLGTP